MLLGERLGVLLLLLLLLLFSFFSVFCFFVFDIFPRAQATTSSRRGL